MPFATICLAWRRMRDERWRSSEEPVSLSIPAQKPAESRPSADCHTGAASIVVPAIVADAVAAAAKRSWSSSPPPRFFGWCKHHNLGLLADIEPLHVAASIEAMQSAFGKPSVKQHVAAISMLFDWLVTGQVVATNPAHALSSVGSTTST